MVSKFVKASFNNNYPTIPNFTQIIKLKSTHNSDPQNGKTPLKVVIRNCLN
jgi:hypothetical protein